MHRRAVQIQMFSVCSWTETNVPRDDSRLYSAGLLQELHHVSSRCTAYFHWAGEVHLGAVQT